MEHLCQQPATSNQQPAVEPPKDAEKRIKLKEQLQERMRLSIKEQGDYGVRQTNIWQKAYKLALKCVKRDFPTCGTLRKRIKALDDAHAWKLPDF